MRCYEFSFLIFNSIFWQKYYQSKLEFADPSGYNFLHDFLPISASEHVKEEKGLDLKFKRHVKNLLVENVYWLHDQLLAMVSWRPVKKNIATNYSVSWSHEECSSATNTRYFAKTMVSSKNCN